MWESPRRRRAGGSAGGWRGGSCRGPGPPPSQPPPIPASALTGRYHAGTMWETDVVCSACSGTHRVCASIIPRAFSYECPGTGQRVDLPFRDPIATPHPWNEVSECSATAVRIDDAQHRGSLEI